MGFNKTENATSVLQARSTAMHAQIPKAQEAGRQPAAELTGQEKPVGLQGYEMGTNGPSNPYQEMADNSPQVSQLRAYQQMADARSGTAQKMHYQQPVTENTAAVKPVQKKGTPPGTARASTGGGTGGTSGQNQQTATDTTTTNTGGIVAGDNGVAGGGAAATTTPTATTTQNPAGTTAPVGKWQPSNKPRNIEVPFKIALTNWLSANLSGIISTAPSEKFVAQMGHRFTCKWNHPFKLQGTDYPGFGMNLHINQTPMVMGSVWILNKEDSDVTLPPNQAELERMIALFEEYRRQTD